METTQRKRRASSVRAALAPAVEGKLPAATTAITHDGLLVRRSEETLEPRQAEKVVRALNHLPTILEAWSQRQGSSDRKLVCWIPATAAAQARMVRSFVDREIARAWSEGARFVWSSTTLGESVRACYNPRSGRTYLVTRLGHDHFRCQCQRYASAGTCKHALDAILRRRFETAQTSETRDAFETVQ